MGRLILIWDGKPRDFIPEVDTDEFFGDAPEPVVDVDVEPGD